MNRGIRLLLATCLLVASPLNAATGKQVDYTNLKPEDYEGIEHKSEFVDSNTGETFRVKNDKYGRGLWIKVTEGDRSQWKRHGAYYELRSDGSVSAMKVYSYGSKEGTWESYTRKGGVKFRTRYVGNLRNGLYEHFTDRGKLFEQGEYKDNRKEGKWTQYYNGKVHFETSWQNGQRHGEKLQYSTSSGKVVARTTFQNGKQVGKTQWY